MSESVPSTRREPEVPSTRRMHEVPGRWEHEAYGAMVHMDHDTRHNPSENESKFGFREIRNALSRHKGVIAACVVIVTSLVAILVTFLPKEYVGEVMISIENQKTEIADLRDTVTRGFLENMQVPSEAEVLRAPDLALRVVDKLNLTENPEFTQSGNQPSSLLAFIPAEWRAALGVSLDEPKQRDLRSATADALLNPSRS